MQQYLISEGYITVVYTDEVTMLEKEVLAPAYSFDIIAENIEIARAICWYLDLGVENEDFMIFERDESIVGQNKPEYQTYMLN